VLVLDEDAKEIEDKAGKLAAKQALSRFQGDKAFGK
jgi:hypothetical protein